MHTLEGDPHDPAKQFNGVSEIRNSHCTRVGTMAQAFSD